METKQECIRDLERVYKELKNTQRKVVFESKSKEESTSLRLLALGWVTCEINTLIETWKTEEQNKLN